MRIPPTGFRPVSRVEPAPDHLVLLAGVGTAPDPHSQQYGEIVSHALGQAEKVSSLATAIRELFDAGQAGEGVEVLELRRAVADTVDDLLPVAESAGVQICFMPGPACRVRFDARRLRQGLFQVIGFVIGSSATAVRIELAESGTEALLRLTVSRAGVYDRPSNANSYQELLRRLGLGIAPAIFEAAGGSLSGPRG
jgi:hypothetical protein